MPWSAWTTRSPGDKVASSSRKAAVALRLRRRRTRRSPGKSCSEGRGEVDRPRRDEPGPFLLRQVECAGLDGAVAAGFGLHRPHAVLVIIVDRLAPRLERLVGARIAKDQVLAEIIEQRVEPFLEQ